MTKKLFSIIICTLLSTLFFTFTSCSDDSDESSLKSDLTINGKSYKAEIPSCDDGYINNDEDIWVGCYFETILNGKEETYHFSIYFYDTYKLANLKDGDVTDIISVSEFRHLSYIGFPTFEITDGKVFLKHTGKDAIMLEFQNFTFINEDTENSYIVNGSIEYKIE